MRERPYTVETVILVLEISRRILRKRKASASEVHEQPSAAGEIQLISTIEELPAMIRLFNTTTRLSVDGALENLFFKIVDPKYLNAVTSRLPQFHVDVQMVNQIDLDLERKRIEKQVGMKKLKNDESSDGNDAKLPDFDLLGVYIPLHPEYHRPVIKVSPEKVMHACLKLREIFALGLDFNILYSSILNAVVVHELAHYLMDSQLNIDGCEIPGKLFIDSGAMGTNTKSVLLGNRCLHHLHVMGNDDSTWLNNRHMVEESLANAFVLAQKFEPTPKRVLYQFIKSQPKAYKAGLRWTANTAKLLDAAASWRDFKRLAPTSGHVSGLQDIVAMLENQPPLKRKIRLWDFGGEIGDTAGIVREFDCSQCNLENIVDVNFPKQVDGNVYAYQNCLTSLKDIHKGLKSVSGVMFLHNNPIKSNVLGLLKIKGLQSVVLDSQKVEAIINKHLKNGRDIFACQEELEDAGFEEFAKL